MLRFLSRLAVLRQFFEDDERSLSCMRLMIFMVLCTVLGLRIWGCLAAGQFIEMSATDAGVIVALLASKAFSGDCEYGGRSQNNVKNILASLNEMPTSERGRRD